MGAMGIGGGVLTGLGQIQETLGTYFNEKARNKSANNPFVLGTGDPLSDPFANATALETLVSLGVVDPSLIDQASPINVALKKYLNTTPIQKKGIDQLLAELQIGVQKYMDGERDPSQFGGILGLASASGMSITELLGQEVAFRERKVKVLDNLTQRADVSAEARRVAGEKLLEAVQSLPVGTGALDSLREQEKASLLRDINTFADERQTDTLRSANLLNFNPGRSLAELDRIRATETQDADLQALGKALAIISSQTDIGNSAITGLQNFLIRPEQQAGTLSAQRLGASTQNPQLLPTTPLNSPAALAAIMGGQLMQQSGSQLSILGALGGGGGGGGIPAGDLNGSRFGANSFETDKLLASGGGLYCHGAAAVFGWFTRDWFAARRWILKGWQGPVADNFRAYYLRNGRHLAKRMRKNWRVMEAWEPFFVWARDRGRDLGR